MIPSKPSIVGCPHDYGNLLPWLNELPHARESKGLNLRVSLKKIPMENKLPVVEFHFQTPKSEIQIMGVHGTMGSFLLSYTGGCCAPRRMGNRFWTWGDAPSRGPASPLNGHQQQVKYGKICMIKDQFHSISRVAHKFHSERVVHSFTLDLLNLQR